MSSSRSYDTDRYLHTYVHVTEHMAGFLFDGARKMKEHVGYTPDFFSAQTTPLSPRSGTLALPGNLQGSVGFDHCLHFRLSWGELGVSMNWDEEVPTSPLEMPATFPYVEEALCFLIKTWQWYELWGWRVNCGSHTSSSRPVIAGVKPHSQHRT